MYNKVLYNIKIKNRTHLVTLVASILFSEMTSSLAQTAKLTGKVAYKSGKPAPAVEIIAKNTSKETLTNSLRSINSDEPMSFIGFKLKVNLHERQYRRLMTTN